MITESSSGGPVVFKPLGAGREAVMLGRVQIGEIVPLDGPRHRSGFRLMLPECAASAWRPARDIAAARAGALRFLNDWLEAADLRPMGGA